MRRFVSKHVSFAVLRGRRTARITSQWATDCATRGTILALRLQCFARCKCLIEIRGHCADGLRKKNGKDQEKDVGMDGMASAPETMRSSRAGFATVTHAPIDLPEQVLVMIVSRVRDVRPATAEADANSLCADVMHGIGSVSRLWRRLCADGRLTWMRVPGAAAAESACLPSRARCRSESSATPDRGTSGRCWDRGR